MLSLWALTLLSSNSPVLFRNSLKYDSRFFVFEKTGAPSTRDGGFKNWTGRIKSRGRGCRRADQTENTRGGRRTVRGKVRSGANKGQAGKASQYGRCYSFLLVSWIVAFKGRYCHDESSTRYFFISWGFPGGGCFGTAARFKGATVGDLAPLCLHGKFVQEAPIGEREGWCLVDY